MHQIWSRFLLNMSDIAWFTLNNIYCLTVNLGSGFATDHRNLKAFVVIVFPCMWLSLRQ